MKSQNQNLRALGLTTAVFFFLATGHINAQEQTRDTTVQKTSIKEVVVLGSRGEPRTATDSPVPVDVFNVKQASVVLPQTNINQMLNSIAPSFTSTVQTAADGTDHLDPAQLRGMGPDQVLVLVNGKRRHTSALVNVNSSAGRGSVGTDLNAIPAFALDRIVVLRDGASAQYGSDAIAGVINLNLRKDLGFSSQLTFGGNLTKAADNHSGNWDGSHIQLDLNYGIKVAKKGFINATFSVQHREPTHRAGTWTGTAFNAYNAIAQRARKAGVELGSFFTNINASSTDTTGLIAAIKQYAGQVDYFDTAFQGQIQSATTIAQLQDLLKLDVTDKEIAYRGLTRDYFNMDVGQSKLNNYQFFINSEIPISDAWKVYAFGGYSFRHGTSGGFYRRPEQARTFKAIFPNGYLPKINTDITDFSIAAGVKGKWGNWNIDLSNTFGTNSFDFNISNSENTSLRFNSPTSFYAGGPRFSQNTINLDFNRNFDWFENFNFAFGVEQRHENFKIKAGQPESYLSYDVFGKPVTPTTPDIEKPTDFFGEALPGGSQVYGGFRADNAVNKSRNSYAAYIDGAFDFTEWLLVDAAARFEHYSDFGNTLNFKLASRVKLNEDFNWRIAGSTGFRAPSIHQIYFNQSSTYFVDGDIIKSGTFSNDSKIAKLLGIPQLKQEKSKSFSTGFTWTIPSAHLSITADGYFIRVDDRIQLSGSFKRPSGDPATLPPSQAQLQAAFDNAGVTSAQFFGNAINTETKGIDVVISHKYSNGSNFRLINDFAINLNDTKQVGDIHSSKLLHEAGLDDVFFSEKSRIYLEEAVPRVKASLSNLLKFNKFDIYLRNTYYGKATDYNYIPDTTLHQVAEAKVITDLSFAYRFSQHIDFTLGVNNLFDIYPTKNIPSLSNNNQFVYIRATSQFGMNGRYVFAKLNFDF